MKTRSMAGLAALVLAITFASQAWAHEKHSPMGGGGGHYFKALCAVGAFLNGVELRAGLYFDAIRPLCVTASGPRQTTPPRAEGDWRGGPGGGPVNLVCPNDRPAVIGMSVVYTGREILTVTFINLFCGLVVAAPQDLTTSDGTTSLKSGQSSDFGDVHSDSQRCSAGLLAVGISGRSGKYLDAVGLICGGVLPQLVVAPPVKPERRITKEDLDLAARGAVIAAQDPLATQLRNQQAEGPARFGFDIGLAAAEWQTLPGPGKQKIHDRLSRDERGGFDAAVSFSLAWTKQRIAELALRGAAIANGDPVAGELRDKQPEGPARRGFEIGLAASEGQTLQGPGKQKVHDALIPAEQGGFTAAVNSSLSRNRQKLTDLAPRGKELTDADPLAVELRNEQPDERARLGFDIGMATAEGQTLQGPGKDARRRTLYADEQGGFAAAVTFSVDRNNNKDLAKVGAAIAEQDQAVATARKAEPDAMHRLGFDIATGLFGDPALGAQGRTGPPGPGSLRIRNGLSDLAQSGFNSSVNFHRRQHYGP